MPDRPAQSLVAIEGADSEDVADLAAALRGSLAERKLPVLVSRWNASALFTDVAAAPVHERDVSPRTLLLLYAADLAFRVRWEIQPALDAGQVVIASPYVATAVAFGLATGLSDDWLSTLLRFAPTPAHTIVLGERKRRREWKRRPERGFGDCCTALLEATPEGFARRKARTAMATALETAAEAHGGSRRKGDRRKLVEEIVTLRNRPAAPSQSRRRSR